MCFASLCYFLYRFEVYSLTDDQTPARTVVSNETLFTSVYDRRREF